MERLWRSVKHEDVYLKGYVSVPELLLGLTEYFVFYNTERTHQSLDYRHTGRGLPDGRAVAEQVLWINSVREKNRAQKQKQNRGSAVPLRMIGYPLKLGLILS